jgi:hypothetical protein
MLSVRAKPREFLSITNKNALEREDRDTDLSEEVKSSSAAPLDATGVASFSEAEEDDPAAASDPSTRMMITAAARAPRWHTGCSRILFSLEEEKTCWFFAFRRRSRVRR